MAESKPSRVTRETRTTSTTRPSTATASVTTSAASGVPQVDQIDPKTRPQSTSTNDVSTGRSTETPEKIVNTKPPVKPGPRLGVRVNVTSISRAFYAQNRSRSVGIIQYVLKDRGFDPGTVDGVASYNTRAAFAEFQRTIEESPTGIPTAESLDLLGFDVVG